MPRPTGHQTRLLLDQLNDFQQAGQWTSALRLCEELFTNAYRSRRLGDLLEVSIRIAFVYRALGDTESARDNFLFAYTVAELCDEHSRAARALNGLGIICQDLGDLEEANRHYLIALKKAQMVTDDAVHGDILTNLGIVANIRGDLTTALRRYTEAHDQYEGTKERSRIARVLNNLGMVQIDLRRFDEAESTLDRALNIARAIPDNAVEGIVLTNKAELYLELNRLGEARRECDAAFEIASRLADDNLRTEVLKFYGMIARRNSQAHLAELHLKQAYDLARSIEGKLLQGEISRELAVLYLGANRNREALGYFISAHNVFSLLQAENETANIASKLSNLEADFMSLVMKWGESIEAKDLYTSGHCKRVAYYSCEIAKKIGISELELNWFRMGAFLHDVGKTETPEEILNKPGKLTDDERRIMENHTIAGDSLLSPIEFPWDIRPMVRSHHERWDGRGYPDQIGGLDIPLAARILKIADVFDALTTSRSYRGALSDETALGIMIDDVGAFDPDLFETFRELLPTWADRSSLAAEGFN